LVSIAELLGSGAAGVKPEKSEDGLALSFNFLFCARRDEKHSPGLALELKSV